MTDISAISPKRANPLYGACTVICCPQEIIVEMKDMVKDMLKQFYRANRQAKPHRIIFYRDGVSEGQFKQVRVCMRTLLLTFSGCLSVQKVCTCASWSFIPRRDQYWPIKVCSTRHMPAAAFMRMHVCTLTSNLKRSVALPLQSSPRTTLSLTRS